MHMTEISDKAFFDYLMAEYNQPISGWDLSYLKGRRTDIYTEPTWNYAETVIAAMTQAHSMLDMRTGGGERLVQFLTRQPMLEVYATEGYLPNVAIARQRLEPLSVIVYEVQDEHLSLADNSLDLVINRHGSYDAHEVWRVLKPGHLFITQQVGDQTNLRLHELLGRTGKDMIVHFGAKEKSAWNLDIATHELEEAVMQIIERKEDFFVSRFHDVGAIAYYLKAVPWEVHDFSVEKYFDKLVDIHHLIQREGYVDVLFHSFFVVAQKS